MPVSPFINIFRTKEEAFYSRTSQENTQFIFKGVQLLPNNPAKYIQLTETPSGIDLEDWTVRVVECDNNNKTDITDSFFVETITNDLNGAPQFFWSLINIHFDFGFKLVYLEITQTIGETFYSTPFMITDIESDKTSQFHYKDDYDSVYQSIGLRAWFLDYNKKTELTTYYQLSTKSTVTQAIRTSDIELFRTEPMSKQLIILMTCLLESPILFVNSLKYSLFEAIDVPKKIGLENFVSVDFQLSPQKNVTFFGLADYNGIDYGKDYNI